MANVVGVDVGTKCVRLEDGADLHYDYLIFAVGAQTT